MSLKYNYNFDDQVTPNEWENNNPRKFQSYEKIAIENVRLYICLKIIYILFITLKILSFINKPQLTSLEKADVTVS